MSQWHSLLHIQLLTLLLSEEFSRFVKSLLVPCFFSHTTHTYWSQTRIRRTSNKNQIYFSKQIICWESCRERFRSNWCYSPHFPSKIFVHRHASHCVRTWCIGTVTPQLCVCVHTLWPYARMPVSCLFVSQTESITPSILHLLLDAKGIIAPPLICYCTYHGDRAVSNCLCLRQLFLCHVWQLCLQANRAESTLNCEEHGAGRSWVIMFERFWCVYLQFVTVLPAAGSYYYGYTASSLCVQMLLYYTSCLSWWERQYLHTELSQRVATAEWGH